MAARLPLAFGAYNDMQTAADTLCNIMIHEL